MLQDLKNAHTLQKIKDERIMQVFFLHCETLHPATVLKFFEIFVLAERGTQISLYCEYDKKESGIFSLE